MGLRFCRRLRFLLPVLLLFLGVLPARAQTTQETVLNAVTVPTASDVVRNIGQTAHYVTYTTSGTVNRLSIQLEGCFGNTVTLCAPAGAGWLRISETATDTARGAISANVYLPLVRVNLTVVSGGGTVTATYSGQSIGFAPPAGEFYTSGIFNKVLSNALPADTTITLDLDLPSGGTGGALYFTFSAAGFAGATIQVDAGPDTAQLSAVLAATSLANVNTTQFFRVTSFPANVARVTYTTGGATAITFDLAYALGGGQVSAVNIVGGQAADGTPVSGNPVRIAGKDASGNTQTIATDASGAVSTGQGGAGTDGRTNSLVFIVKDTGQAGSALGIANHCFNGSTWDRCRSADATTLTDTVSTGVTLVAPLSTWGETDAPAAATVATATKAAGAAGVRHVVTSISASLHNGGGIFDGRSIRLRDGVSGAGTILWELELGITATAGDTDSILISGLSIIGSAATAMTLEFNAAPSANNFEKVNFTGYSVQ